MHGRRGRSAPTSAGIIPWMSIYIVESVFDAAAPSRRRAFGGDEGGIGCAAVYFPGETAKKNPAFEP